MFSAYELILEGKAEPGDTIDLLWRDELHHPCTVALGKLARACGRLGWHARIRVQLPPCPAPRHVAQTMPSAVHQLCTGMPRDTPILA